MISFVTSQDDATRACLALYNQIAINWSVSILNGNATRQNLLRNLACRDDPLVIMSHGRRTPDNCIVSHSNEVALHEGDLQQYIRNRSVFAFCCWTGERLGRIAANHGSVWWGFHQPISAPPATRRREIYIFFQQLFIDFHINRTVVDVNNKLKSISDEIKFLEKFYARRYRRGERTIRLTEMLMCLSGIKSYICVWIPGEPNYITIHDVGTSNIDIG